MICSSMVTTTSFSTFAWNSIAIKEAVSKSMTSFTVAITPIIINFLMTSAAVAFKRSANSFTTISSGMVMVICFFCLSSWIRFKRSASVSLREFFGFPLYWLLLCVSFCLFTVWSVFTFSLAKRSYFSL